MSQAAAPHRLLIVDDDSAYRERLVLAMSRRGYQVRHAASVAEALPIAEEFAPQAFVIDLKMPGENGMTLAAEARRRWPDARIVILTGYGSITTAMESGRLGAADYLAKPADADQIQAALEGRKASEDLATPTLGRVEWEHLHRVLADCGNNVTRAAQRLGIDRRSLQRKLAKYPPLR